MLKCLQLINLHLTHWHTCKRFYTYASYFYTHTLHTVMLVLQLKHSYIHLHTLLLSLHRSTFASNLISKMKRDSFSFPSRHQLVLCLSLQNKQLQIYFVTKGPRGYFFVASVYIHDHPGALFRHCVPSRYICRRILPLQAKGAQLRK